MRTYYAKQIIYGTDHEIYEGNDAEDSCDLYKFESKAERDVWIDEELNDGFFRDTVTYTDLMSDPHLKAQK